MSKYTSGLSKNWHLSFYTLWLGCFITGMGYSMTMPFISLFISDLGNYNKLEINLYSGLAFAMTFIAQAIVSPFWGSLADQKGRVNVYACQWCNGINYFFNWTSS